MKNSGIRIYWDRESRSLPICFCYNLPDDFNHMVSKGSIIEITPLHSGTKEEVEMLMMLYPDLPVKKIRCLIEDMYQVWGSLLDYFNTTYPQYYWPDILEDMTGIDLEKFKFEMEDVGITV